MAEIYVHIPFCERKCVYCDFASVGGFASDEKSRYVDALLREINCSGGKKISTIFLGGGTPSVLSAFQIEQILDAIFATFSVEKNAEISIEVNPNSGDEKKLIHYRKMGINRISFGVQSLSDEVLCMLGRLHSAQEAKKAIALAEKAGFDNINCDLLIGVGGDASSDAKLLASLGVEHISTYMLQLEPATPLFNMVKSGKILLPSEEQTSAEYEKTCEALATLGFEHYEVSNFAKAGRRCRHNMGYWTGEEYFGFGLGAHSFLGNERIANSRTFSGYYAGEKWHEELTRKQRIEEKIMLGLRTSDGLNLANLKDFGYDIQTNLHFNQFLEQGLLVKYGEKVVIPEKYFLISNSIISALFPQ